jgi:hypothetical protein
VLLRRRTNRTAAESEPGLPDGPRQFSLPVALVARIGSLEMIVRPPCRMASEKRCYQIRVRGISYVVHRQPTGARWALICSVPPGFGWVELVSPE